ncbi:MAG: CcoQ/FixQ family Cbb3-type cytochrome c oxidase assembly chaperone [Bacteroidetes bacterium]|nr:MAG: CcoQ/FixQ family Cbb3-type cytochrome c oxidase assembly chaperone [Bacteroidota bacterium]
MYKYLLESVEGIQWFGIIALLIFFGTFCFALVRIFFSKDSDLDKISRLPLDD